MKKLQRHSHELLIGNVAGRDKPYCWPLPVGELEKPLRGVQGDFAKRHGAFDATSRPTSTHRPQSMPTQTVEKMSQV